MVGVGGSGLIVGSGSGSVVGIGVGGIAGGMGRTSVWNGGVDKFCGTSADIECVVKQIVKDVESGRWQSHGIEGSAEIAQEQGFQGQEQVLHEHMHKCESLLGVAGSVDEHIFLEDRGQVLFRKDA